MTGMMVGTSEDDVMMRVMIMTMIMMMVMLSGRMKRLGMMKNADVDDDNEA